MKQTASPYIKIESPDDKYFVWINREDIDGKSYMVSNVNPMAAFADAIDRLEYVSVNRTYRMDEEMFSVLFEMEGSVKECLNRLVEDVPEIMEGMKGGEK